MLEVKGSLGKKPKRKEKKAEKVEKRGLKDHMSKNTRQAVSLTSIPRRWSHDLAYQFSR